MVIFLASHFNGAVNRTLQLASLNKLCVMLKTTRANDLQITTSEATREAFEKTGITPARLQSDKGNCYISDDFRRLMNQIEIEHCRIHPHCPNENDEIERYHRTLKEGLDVT
jgi:transposase InsO family protein